MAYKPITDQQLRLYMTDLQIHSQRTSAARAGFSERTARRFDVDPTFPSNRKIVHGRTVADPLEGYWEDDLLPLLENDSALQAVTLLRHLQSEHPLAFPDDRIRRTLERRVRQWRALKGPERDIIFRQTPEPGYMALSDFTHAGELDVTIAGQPFAGHAHAETTIINYLHLSDLITGLRLAKEPYRMDAQSAARSFATNTGAMPVQADGCVALEVVRPWLMSKLPTRQICEGLGRMRGPVRPQPTVAVLTPRRAWQALALRTQTSVSHIALSTRVVAAELAALFDRAERLAALVTRKGRRRLIEDGELPSDDWLPDRLWSSADLEMAVDLCDHIWELGREGVIAWCIPALLDAERHHPGVRHYAPGTAHRWIKTASPIITPKNWRVTLLLAAGDEADSLSKVWQEGLGRDVPLVTERTQAGARDLTFARARVVNCRTDGTTAWPIVRSAAFLLVALDAPVFHAVIAADTEQARRRRVRVRDLHGGTE